MLKRIALTLALIVSSATSPAFAQSTASPTVATIKTNGTIAAANGTVTLKPLSGQNTCSVTLSGTFTATLTMYALDAQGATYAVTGYQMSGSPSISTMTAAGFAQFPCGSEGFQVKATSYTSGTVTVNVTASAMEPNTWPVVVSAALPAGSNTIGAVTQASGPWSSNMTQVNGTSLGSPTAAGTAASGNILSVQGNASGVALPVSGTVTSNVGTGTRAVNLTQVNGSTVALGSATSANSIPVVVASNQAAFPVTAQGANSSGAWTPVFTDKAFQAIVTTATTSQLVALSGTTLVYIGSINILNTSSTASDVTLEYGTGTNCGTGTTTIWKWSSLSSSVPGISYGTPGGPGVGVVPAGNALCVVTSAAANVSVNGTYAQR